MSCFQKPSKRRGIFAVLFVAVAMRPLIGVAGPVVDILWDSAGHMRHHAHVAPGKFLEVCGRLAAGQKVDWQFVASQPLDFNIHFHVGKDVSYPEKRNASAKANATLTVDREQDYCWMWTNKSDQLAHLDLQLQKLGP